MSCVLCAPFIRFLCICLLSPFLLYAQDAHYWNSAYSPGALLTPGATVVNDNDSGVYYLNPALTALHPRNAARISANLYQLKMTDIKDGIGKGKGLESTNWGIVPVMVSGTLYFQGERTIVLGYSLIHDAISSYYVNQRQDKRMQVLDDAYSPGPEFYVGQYTARNRSSNTQASGSVAMTLNEHWAAGLTIEALIRSQDFSEQYSSRALINTPDSVLQYNQMTNVSSDYQLTYWNMRLRFKAGLSFESGPHHLGLVLSPPSANIRGRATITSDLVISDLHLIPGVSNPLFNLLANGRQTGVHVKYKDPWSISLGYALDYPRGQIQVMGTYFAGLNRYKIISPANQSFIRPDTGNNVTLTSDLLQFNEKRKSVVNVAVGWKHHLNERMTGYISFSTDFNYADNDIAPGQDFQGYPPNTSTWDLYHFNFGINIPRKRANLHAGLLLSYGRTTHYLQPVNFDTPREDNLLVGDRQYTTGRYLSAGLLLGYLFNL